MTTVIQDKDKKEYHLKHLLELSLKSLGEIPQLEDPTEEQKEWVKHHINRSRMRS